MIKVEFCELNALFCKQELNMGKEMYQRYIYENAPLLKSYFECVNPFFEKERILLERDNLLERRAQVCNCWFLSFRNSKIAEIRLIDKQIDLLENQLISMQRDEYESMIAHTKKII